MPRSRARSRRTEFATVVQTRVTTTMDAAIASLAEKRGVTFSEATRQLLELGLVALAAVERERPSGAYRFAVVDVDADDSDEPTIVPDEPPDHR